MNNSYNNILVSITDELNAQKSVARAIDLATAGKSVIHLAQLIPTWNPFASLTHATAYVAQTKHALDSYIKTLFDLMRWKDLIQKQAHVQQVKIHIMRGPSVSVFLEDITQRTPIDLIIITTGSPRRWGPHAFSPSGDQLARETRCAVLSLTTQTRRGIREEMEMFSEPLAIRRYDQNSRNTAGFGLAPGYSLLSRN